MPNVPQGPLVLPEPDPDPATGLMYQLGRGYMRDLYAPMDAGYVGPSEVDPTDRMRRRMYHGAGGQPPSFANGLKGIPTAEQEALQAPAIDPILAASFAAPGSFGPMMASKFLFQQMLANAILPSWSKINKLPLPTHLDAVHYGDTNEPVHMTDIAEYLAHKNARTPFGMSYGTLRGIRQYLGSRIASAEVDPQYRDSRLVQGTAKVFSKLLNTLPSIEQYTKKYGPKVEEGMEDLPE